MPHYRVIAPIVMCIITLCCARTAHTASDTTDESVAHADSISGNATSEGRDPLGLSTPMEERVKAAELAGRLWRVSATELGGLTAVDKAHLQPKFRLLMLSNPTCRAYARHAGFDPGSISTPSDKRPHPGDDAIILDATEALETTTWQDWNRISGSVLFIGQELSGPRAFITISSKSSRLRFPTYSPKVDNPNAYDLTYPPDVRVLTHAQVSRHFGQLPDRKVASWFPLSLIDEDRVYWAFGFSPPGFKLGNTQTTAFEADHAAYVLGMALQVNPSASVTMGVATIDARHYAATYGLSFDFAILTAVIK